MIFDSKSYEDFNKDCLYLVEKLKNLIMKKNFLLIQKEINKTMMLNK